MDKQLFFFSSLFLGERRFSSLHVFKGSCSSSVTCNTKVIPKPFLLLLSASAPPLERKEKEKKERDSPGEGGKTFLPLELLKPTSSLYTLQKYPREHNQPIRGKRDCDLVQQPLFPPFSHSASQKHPLATSGKSSSCDSLLVLYFKRFYSVPEVFDICHTVALTPPALCCHVLYIVLRVQEESRAPL